MDKTVVPFSVICLAFLTHAFDYSGEQHEYQHPNQHSNQHIPYKLENIPVPGFGKLIDLGQSVGLHEVPEKVIQTSETVAYRVPVPYEVKVPHKVPYPVHVNKIVHVPVTQAAKAPEAVPVSIGHSHSDYAHSNEGTSGADSYANDGSSGAAGGYAPQHDASYGNIDTFQSLGNAYGDEDFSGQNFGGHNIGGQNFGGNDNEFNNNHEPSQYETFHK